MFCGSHDAIRPPSRQTGLANRGVSTIPIRPASGRSHSGGMVCTNAPDAGKAVFPLSFAYSGCDESECEGDGGDGGDGGGVVDVDDMDDMDNGDDDGDDGDCDDG